MKMVHPNFSKCNLDLNLALGSTTYIVSERRGIRGWVRKCSPWVTVAELAPRYLVAQIWSINLSYFQSFLFCICPWIRQLFHWIYGNHGEKELCICLLQINCELKKKKKEREIPYTLLKNSADLYSLFPFPGSA